jgi:hypothetical protein
MTASLSMQAPNVGYWFQYSFDRTLVDVTHSFRTADDGIDFSVRFTLFPQRAPGTYVDTLSVRLCYDESCTREVQGSPFNLPLRLEVGYFAKPEAGITPLVPQQTTVLNHDVRGAAYSAALDAVVTVSAVPEPRLRVHDLRSGQVRSLPLLTAPTSLSLQANGLHAAVGHDAAVSLVDLRAGAESPVRRFTVPVPVGGVVLAGTRIVAMGGQPGNWNNVFWVDTVTGVATQAGSSLVYGIGDSALHPTGDRVYTANRGLSPDDISRMDLTGDPAAAQFRDSRYHGEYPFCGRLALSPEGSRLYSGCGVVLSLAPQLAEDMLYAGQLALSPADSSTSQRLVSAGLSVAPGNTSVAVLEENSFYCNALVDQLEACHTRLSVHSTSTLARQSLRGLSTYERGSEVLRQWGRYILHRSDGSLIMIAEVRTRNEATPTWLVHRLGP